MTVKLKVTSFFVDKPNVVEIEVDNTSDAVQLPDGTIYTVEQLEGEALDAYIYEKYIQGTPHEGRILSMEIEK